MVEAKAYRDWADPRSCGSNHYCSRSRPLRRKDRRGHRFPCGIGQRFRHRMESLAVAGLLLRDVPVVLARLLFRAQCERASMVLGHAGIRRWSRALATGFRRIPGLLAFFQQLHCDLWISRCSPNPYVMAVSHRLRDPDRWRSEPGNRKRRQESCRDRVEKAAGCNSNESRVEATHSLTSALRPLTPD